MSKQQATTTEELDMTQPVAINTDAAALVDTMIANAETVIHSVNVSLDQALVTLEARTAKVQLQLTGAAGIFEPGIAEAAQRVEELVQRREAAYRELRSLKHVRKAC